MSTLPSDEPEAWSGGGGSAPDALRLRARMVGAVRTFLDGAGFVEVDTPVRLRVPALERHIDAVPSGAAYLRTSPELHMKRLIAAGMTRAYQLGPCFRRGEAGRLHSPEFTMLEWYRADADYMGILDDMRGLIRAVVPAVLGGTRITHGSDVVDVGAPWEVLDVAAAFERHAGWNPVKRYDADRFDLDLVNKVEPALRRDRPVVLKDYPVAAAALARCREDPWPVAERWELYVAGLELANAYTELIDAEEQRRRFEACAEERRRAGLDVYALDTAFLGALEQGMPPCGGVAMGIDRLAMLLGNVVSIDGVRAFCRELVD